MSEDRRHATDFMMKPPYSCWNYESPPEWFYVLSNPNKCVYGYEKTRYPLQSYHDDATLSPDGRFFYPSFHFVNALNDNSSNLFARAGGFIGFHSTNSTNGKFYHCPHMGDPIDTDRKMGEVLFVDCLQSLLTVTSGNEVSLVVKDSDLSSVVRKKVINFKQVHKNVSPSVEMHQTVTISFQTQERARATLSASIAKKQCLEKQFLKQGREWGGRQWIEQTRERNIDSLWWNQLFSGSQVLQVDAYDKIMGRSTKEAILKVSALSRQSCGSEGLAKESESEVTKTSDYKHEQNIVIPLSVR